VLTDARQWQCARCGSSALGSTRASSRCLQMLPGCFKPSGKGLIGCFAALAALHRGDSLDRRSYAATTLPLSFLRGGISGPGVNEAVASADVVVSCGVVNTDYSTLGHSHKLLPEKVGRSRVGPWGYQSHTYALTTRPTTRAP
jgi:hypothetical protein